MTLFNLQKRCAEGGTSTDKHNYFNLIVRTGERDTTQSKDGGKDCRPFAQFSEASDDSHDPSKPHKWTRKGYKNLPPFVRRD